MTTSDGTSLNVNDSGGGGGGTSCAGTIGLAAPTMGCYEGMLFGGNLVPLHAGADGTSLAVALSNGATSGLALDTTLQLTNTDLGALGSTACATDNGSCSLNQLIQRANQRLTTINTTLGSPFQAGGTATVNAGTGWTVTQGSTTSGQGQSLVGCAVTTGAPSYTTAQTSPCSLDTSGNLRVTGTVTTAGVAQASTTSGQTVQLSGVATVTAPTGTYTTAKTNPLTGDVNGSLYAQLHDNGGTTMDDTSNHALHVVSPVTTAAGTALTRPADTTAYSQNDLIASSTTAGSVAVPSFTGAVLSTGSVLFTGARLATNKTSGWSAATFHIELWSSAPTFTNGDNGAYAVATGAASWVGSCTVSLFTQVADGAYGSCVPDSLNALAIKSATVYWSLQLTNSAGATPASGQTFTFTPELIQGN